MRDSNFTISKFVSVCVIIMIFVGSFSGNASAAVDPMFTGVDGPLVIDGTTVNMSPSTKRYSSVRIINGGILNIVGNGSWMIIGSAGDFYVASSSHINYAGVVNVSGDTGTTTTAPDGRVLSYSSVGGAGGDGGSLLCGSGVRADPNDPLSYTPGGCGGLAAFGNGGGGSGMDHNGNVAMLASGGLGANAPGPTALPDGHTPGTIPPGYVGGAGGTSTALQGGNGMSWRATSPYYTTGDGGGGGFQGTNGGAIYIKAGGVLDIEGETGLYGTNGGAGGDGGNAVDAPGAFGGSGGGGGAGGNPGVLIILAASIMNGVSYNMLGGAGGAGGAGGLATGDFSSNPVWVDNGSNYQTGAVGSDGSNGNDESPQVSSYQYPVPAGVASHSTISTSSIVWTWSAPTLEGYQTVGSYTASVVGLSGGSGVLASTTTSWSKNGLVANTRYTLNLQATNNYGTVGSTSSSLAYTAAPNPTGLAASGVTLSTVGVSADAFSNASADQSGYYFKNTTNAHVSGWIQSNNWQDSPLSCSTSYNYVVQYRNGDGVQTATSTPVAVNTSACATTVVNNTVVSSSSGGSVSYALLSQILAPSASTTAYLDSLKGENLKGGFTPSRSTVLFVDRNLQVGLTGSDVQMLQHYLNAHGFIVVSSGPGSPGYETNTFGLMTKKALIKFQKAHKIPTTGFYGPITRAYVASH